MGHAAFSTSSLPEGDHVITAVYDGTPAFATSSDTVNHRVDNATSVVGNTYCNTGAITTPETPNPATPYPSNIFVTGAATTLGKVTVQLRDVTHAYTDDLDVLLVGPTGQNLVLVSDAGDGLTATLDVTVTFDDAAPSPIPMGSWGTTGSSVTYQPKDHDPGGAADTFPPPAPAPSSATALAAFNGSNPNGTWSLYVVEDGVPDGGTIAAGWCLTLTAADTTPPTVTVEQAAGQADPTAVSPVNFTVTFAEPVTGFTGTDVSFAGSTAVGTLTAAVTGGPQVYNVAVSGMTGSGTVVLSVPAGVATDPGGNPNVASTSTDNTVTFTVTPAHPQSLPGVVAGSTSWSLRNSLTTGGPTTSFTYGTRPPALVPLTGDWDGDGEKTPGIFQGGVFKLRNANSAGPPDLTFTFGDPRGFPVSGDFDGDGVDDVAVFRAGTWQVRNTVTGATSTFTFGAGVWPSVVPVPGDWDADGDDTVGVKARSTWLLNNANDSGGADVTLHFGGANDLPVVWAT